MMGRMKRMLRVCVCVSEFVDYEDRLLSVKMRKDTRTGVNGGYVLERAEHQHEYDPDAEDLNTAPGHVQHESLHRKRFGR